MSQSPPTMESGGSDGIAATKSTDPVLVPKPASASDSPAAAAVVPVTNNTGDIDTAPGHIPASSNAAAVVLGSISGARPPLPPTTATAFEELINEENNNRVPTHEDRMLLNHVVPETTKAADVLMRTPIDSNNNNNSTSDSDRKEKDETMDALSGDGKVATFSNNGSPAMGQKEGMGTTRRRVVANDGAALKESLEKGKKEEEEEKAPKTDEAAEVEGAGGCNNKEKEAAAMMLQDWNEMPRYLQFNPYVLTGYRPLQNISECLASLFYFHNETFNILTHGEFGFYGISGGWLLVR